MPVFNLHYMKAMFFLSTLLLSIHIFCQEKKIELQAGRSFNGTGDIRGVGLSLEYSKTIKKKFDWTVSIGSNIHDGSFPILFEYTSGNMVDGSVRYTTAGMQAAYSLGYSFIKTGGSDLRLKIGGLLRFQSTSYYDDVTVLYPTLTGLSYPVIVFRNSNPQRTVSAGLITQFGYKVNVNKKICVGVVGSFQFDTNGDNISQLMLSLGRRF